MEPINRCPSCRAPNPKGRNDCWSCRAALAAPTPAVATPGPAPALDVPAANPWGMEAYRRTCAGCGHVHGIFNRACPRCGAPTEAAIPVHSRTLSSRWEQTPTPEGGTCLRLKPQARWQVGGGALAWLSIPLLTLALAILDRINGSSYSHWGDLVFAAIFPAVFWLCYRHLLPNALYHGLGREEWHVTPDRLEVRRELFGQGTLQVYEHAALFLAARRIRTGRGSYILARLQVLHHGRARTLAVRWGPRGIEELETVGSTLAELAGWTFHVQPSAADLKKPWFWL